MYVRRLRFVRPVRGCVTVRAFKGEGAASPAMSDGPTTINSPVAMSEPMGAIEDVYADLETDV